VVVQESIAAHQQLYLQLMRSDIMAGRLKLEHEEEGR
jgi:hypothetical protein